MAIKKTPLKKVTRKTSVKYNTFTAKIFGVKVEGIVKKDKNGDYFLLQNEKDGANISNGKEGFKYSWAVGTYLNKEILMRQGVSNFISKEPFTNPKVLNYLIGGYKIEIKDKEAIFGCGSVRLTKKQVLQGLKIIEILKADEELKKAFLNQQLHTILDNEKNIRKLSKEKF